MNREIPDHIAEEIIAWFDFLNGCPLTFAKTGHVGTSF
jgi:hypothetical protein